MSDRILDASLDELRATRTSVKWRFFPQDVLPVWVAEMDARPCTPVVDAVTAALSRGDTGYGWAPPFAAAFADFAGERWGWQVDPDDALVLPDVMIGVAEIIHALTKPGDAVVISPPVYDSFFGFVESTRRRLVTAPLDADGRLDMGALAAAFVDAGPGSIYLLCSPHNPTGTVHTADELSALATLADRHDVLVVSDEIHAPMTHPGVTFTPYLSLGAARRGIALVSASKSWNIAGLKAALALPGPDAQATLGRLHEVVRHGANHLAVIAQTVAYREGGPWLAQVTAELAENRTLLGDLLARELPTVVIHPSSATYLAWLDCRALGLGDDPAAQFVARGRVALSSGLAYDPAARGFARFNYATSPEVITEAVTRMRAALG